MPAGQAASFSQFQMYSVGASHLDCVIEEENKPPQERPRLLGHLLADRGANMSTILLECAYERRTLLYASEALLDEDDSYWKTGLVAKGAAKAHHLCPGALCVIGSIEQAILRGMRLINKIGPSGGSGPDHTVSFRMDAAAGTTKIDAAYSFRGRAVNLAVREQNRASAIVLYLWP